MRKWQGEVQWLPCPLHRASHSGPMFCYVCHAQALQALKSIRVGMVALAYSLTSQAPVCAMQVRTRV
jgi:hypothetical protein